MTAEVGHPSQVAGVVLAGGLSRRWNGGEKCLAELGGQALLDHVIERVQPQVRLLILNANGDLSRFAPRPWARVADSVAGFAGPLAGILAGLDWTRANLPGVPWLLSAPGDAPFLPADLAARLLAAVTGGGADMACAVSGGRTHPVVGLWPVALADALRHALVFEDEHKIDAWTAGYKIAAVEWSTEPSGSIDPFYNINKPEDLVEAERLLGRLAPNPLRFP